MNVAELMNAQIQSNYPSGMNLITDRLEAFYCRIALVPGSVNTSVSVPAQTESNDIRSVQLMTEFKHRCNYTQQDFHSFIICDLFCMAV